MLYTRDNARRVIREAYGPDFKIRITTSCTIGVRPSTDDRVMLAWRALDKGKDSVVSVGILSRDGQISW